MRRNIVSASEKRPVPLSSNACPSRDSTLYGLSAAPNVDIGLFHSQRADRRPVAMDEGRGDLTIWLFFFQLGRAALARSRPKATSRGNLPQPRRRAVSDAPPLSPAEIAWSGLRPTRPRLDTEASRAFPALP